MLGKDTSYYVILCQVRLGQVGTDYVTLGQVRSC